MKILICAQLFPLWHGADAGLYDSPEVSLFFMLLAGDGGPGGDSRSWSIVPTGA